LRGSASRWIESALDGHHLPRSAAENCTHIESISRPPRVRRDRAAELDAGFENVGGRTSRSGAFHPDRSRRTDQRMEIAVAGMETRLTQRRAYLPTSPRWFRMHLVQPLARNGRSPGINKKSGHRPDAEKAFLAPAPELQDAPFIAAISMPVAPFALEHLSARSISSSTSAGFHRSRTQNRPRHRGRNRRARNLRSAVIRLVCGGHQLQPAGMNAGGNHRGTAAPADFHGREAGQ